MTYKVFLLVFFFFQAEDGIRDVAVTGVQTCALPISRTSWTLPKGVSTLSSATEPTTRRSPTPAPRRGEVPVEQEREPLPRLRRERRGARDHGVRDRKSTRLNSSHGYISYAVFCFKKKKTTQAESHS